MKIIEYIKQHAAKAYEQICSIAGQPRFLFSNDPALVSDEYRYNYQYITGFNRLLKRGRITTERIFYSFMFLERELESYLQNHYKNKSFVLYIPADTAIPAFALTLVSYHGEEQLVGNVDLEQLIEWYKENAYFDGITIIEEQQAAEEHDGQEDTNTEQNNGRGKRYIKLIQT
ncbi:hypothetical protein [Paenibacillus sp. y28]|uniref:hypothetical protein n=1 Tax=Paenibacillus sp. y28 TaxID=3129110 RepID=UPI003019D265